LFWIRPRPLKQDQVHNILLIKLERIGDVVLSTPAIRAIKSFFPDSNISIVVNLYTKPLIKNDPHINEVYTYDKRKSLKKKIHFIKELRRKKFDLAVDLGTRDLLFTSVWLLSLSKTRIAVGLNNFGRGFLYNYKVSPSSTPLPYSQEVLNILAPLGITDVDIQPKLYLSEEDITYIQDYLTSMGIKSGDLLIGIHPGGYFKTLRWTKHGYAQVADYLITKYNAKVFFLGSTKEQPLVDEVVRLMKEKPIDVAGKTSLGQLMALISQCQLFIGGSSGPLNIALGLEVPTISFLGPSIPERWWPQGEKHIVLRKDLPCSPCRSGYCFRGDIACMVNITKEEVIEAVDKQLQF
jgi:lipopolysaccharide heptosyltransferase II